MSTHKTICLTTEQYNLVKQAVGSHVRAYTNSIKTIGKQLHDPLAINVLVETRNKLIDIANEHFDISVLEFRD